MYSCIGLNTNIYACIFKITNVMVVTTTTATPSVGENGIE